MQIAGCGKAQGGTQPSPQFEVAIWHFKSLHSSLDSWSTKGMALAVIVIPVAFSQIVNGGI